MNTIENHPTDTLPVFGIIRPPRRQAKHDLFDEIVRKNYNHSSDCHYKGKSGYYCKQ